MVVLSGQKVVFMSHMNTDLIFLLLSGGRSVRMGEEKAFLPIGHRSNFLKKLIQKLNVFSKELYISIRSDQVSEYTSLFSKERVCIDQNFPIQGPLLGLLSSHFLFKQRESNYQAIFVFPIDIPFVKLKTIQRLINLYQKNPNVSGIFYQSISGLEPLCGIYHRQTLENWESEIHSKTKLEFSLQKKIRSICPQPEYISLPQEEEKFFRNINTKQDLESYSQ